MQSSSTWSPMVSAPEDDFSNFLDFGDLQLNFQHFDASAHNQEENQDGIGGPQLDLHNTHNDVGVMDFHHGDMSHFTDPAVMGDFNGSSNLYADSHMPSQTFERQQQQQQTQQPPTYGQPYMPHNIIPQTPNSIEMHGGQAQYQQVANHNHTRAMHEHYRYQTKGQTTFTPLVSPAVTPHDVQFHYQDYAVPGEYFSPLTSPALEAQNHASQRSVYSAVRGSDTSDTTSPTDMNIDPSLQNPNLNGARRSRRKASTTAQRNLSRTVRQSPSMKPQTRKKQLSSTSIPSNRVSEIIEDAGNAKRSTNVPQRPVQKLPMAISQESSEAESVSPESLSEILMPPPATPKSASASKSPQIVAKPGSQSAPMPPKDSKPVTPASLMRIRKGASKSASSALKEQSSRLESQLEQTMEDIVLPDSEKSSSKRPALTPLRTSDATEDDTTPTMSARKTPKMTPTAPTSAPVTATGSAFPSPNTNPMASPNAKRGDSRAGGRQVSKRANSGSSPALHPRISPNIKPLLPEGVAFSAEKSALLLASKSNYQNILDGTHLPGVSYPENLSTNLTSKRTSHKLAEQGRRTRINNALHELAGLLPSTPMGPIPKDAISSGKMNSPGANVMMTGTQAQQNNSKAVTVETAIDYIKSLEETLKDTKARLEVAELKLANDCDGDAAVTKVVGTNDE